MWAITRSMICTKWWSDTFLPSIDKFRISSHDFIIYLLLKSSLDFISRLSLRVELVCLRFLNALTTLFFPLYSNIYNSIRIRGPFLTQLYLLFLWNKLSLTHSSCLDSLASIQKLNQTLSSEFTEISFF